jgi:urea carboxylase
MTASADPHRPGVQSARPRAGRQPYRTFADGSRASHGGDEFVFVELAEEMTLEASLRAQAITRALAALDLSGVVDIAPANASYLVRHDPDVLGADRLLGALAEMHGTFQDVDAVVIDTAIVDMPTLYNDPWTTEVCLRFRDRHQSPDETDLEYTARVNGFASIDGLVAAHTSAPFIVTFPCFRPGNAEAFQLVPRQRQIEVPKYVHPRTETPARAVAHGGAFTVVYPTAGVGGYQLLGRTPVPVVDLSRRSAAFRDSPVLLPISTLVSFRAIDRSEFDEIADGVSRGVYLPHRAPVTFEMSRYVADPDTYVASLAGALR